MLVMSCPFYNCSYFTQINVKFLWSATKVMFDVWYKFQEFRFDGLRVIKITNALCFFAPILNRSACLN